MQVDQKEYHGGDSAVQKTAKQEISSSIFVAKYVVPLGVFYLLYCGITDNLFTREGLGAFNFNIMLILLMCLIYIIMKIAWFGKNVAVDNGHLYISNCLFEKKIPIHQVKEIKQTFFMRIYPEYVTVIFKKRTPVGKTIVFIPKEIRYFSYLSFKPHLIVNELNDLLKEASGSGTIHKK